MRCRYCFYADVTKGRHAGDLGRMTPDTLNALVRRALSEATSFCSFGFQGGEPTLAGLDFFRALVELVERHNKRGVKVVYALQTNGLLIDEDWARFLAEHRFLTGISIDAGRGVHDTLRLDNGGQGTHKRAMKAAELMARHGAAFNILSVVTNDLAAHPRRTYDFYRENGFHHLQFIPCIGPVEGPDAASPHVLRPRDYGKFLCETFDLWYRDYAKGDYRSVRTFENYIRILAGGQPENCAMSGACKAHPVVEADGGVYPCDFYATDCYRLGSVETDTFDSMLSGDRAQAFEAPSRHIDATCRTCEYLALCRGGCRRDREPLTGGLPGRNRYCESYKAFFAHALGRMREVSSRI